MQQVGVHSSSWRLTIDAAVGAVRAPALLLCHVDLDVADLQHIHVQTLHLQHRPWMTSAGYDMREECRNYVYWQQQQSDEQQHCSSIEVTCWSGRVSMHTSALLSAFLSRLSRNTADFLGHRAWPLVLCSFLACRQEECAA